MVRNGKQSGKSLCSSMQSFLILSGTRRRVPTQFLNQHHQFSHKKLYLTSATNHVPVHTEFDSMEKLVRGKNGGDGGEGRAN